jgi:hypothetical protein
MQHTLHFFPELPCLVPQLPVQLVILAAYVTQLAPEINKLMSENSNLRLEIGEEETSHPKCDRTDERPEQAIDESHQFAQECFHQASPLKRPVPATPSSMGDHWALTHRDFLRNDSVIETETACGKYLRRSI